MQNGYWEEEREKEKQKNNNNNNNINIFEGTLMLDIAQLP